MVWEMMRVLVRAGILIFVLLGLDFTSLAGQARVPPSTSGSYAGSAGCRSCHEKFYRLWSTSFHGLAMRPYTPAFAKVFLTPQPKAIPIGQAAYRMEIGSGQGIMVEATGKAEKKYAVTQVLGGKNVFYFLTPLDKGRLQVLPLAYDVRKKEWFDMAGSGVRHFPGGATPAVTWKEWPYTFNTGCYGCHVSQLATNYDPATDTYRSTWTEPGINCETCHGPGREHVRVCEAAPKGQPPTDMKLIRGGRDFTHAQQNDACAGCHAKTVPLTTSFRPGDRYFDHFDLIGFESPDFYPDGRDLGENYTLTSWSRSPCVRSGRLDCMHCHTSSGRYKYKEAATANEACNPCHAARVANAPSHTHHPEGSPGNRCISCHMPMTDFARMRRSDHSMLPPTPATTLAYGSPNACSLCHADKDAAWADARVREWHPRDYQEPVLRQAGLIDAARRRDWSRLSDMLDALGPNGADPVLATSLIRLLRACPNPAKWDRLIAATGASSPLVRAAAVEALEEVPSPQALEALLAAASDDFRLVRVRAAASLSDLPRSMVPPASQPTVDKAQGEYLASLAARPDLWTSQYNLGNYYLAQGDAGKALACFDKARCLDGQAVPPLVNMSIAYSRMGDVAKAEAALVEALRLAPQDAPALFNLGLLKAEQGDRVVAEKQLRAALAADPIMAEAAYNLSLLVGRDHPDEALELIRKACALRPDNHRYAYVQALYLSRAGNPDQAQAVLRPFVERQYADEAAVELYRQIVKKTRQQ